MSTHRTSVIRYLPHLLHLSKLVGFRFTAKLHALYMHETIETNEIISIRHIFKRLFQFRQFIIWFLKFHKN